MSIAIRSGIEGFSDDFLDNFLRYQFRIVFSYIHIKGEKILVQKHVHVYLHEWRISIYKELGKVC